MDAVAAEAMVSRATAYRHFPSIEALLVEAPIDQAAPEAAALFAADTSTDARARLDRAEAALHAMTFGHEHALRAMLAASLTRPAAEKAPRRQNRRAGLIDAALAPARRRFTPAAYKRLTAALALVFGTESMIVFRDVLGMTPDQARRVKSWAIRALVDAALADSAPARARRAAAP
jgi:AcrR family transcriptional regulator